MFKRVLLFHVLCVFVASLAQAADLPSAQSILDKAIENSGGRAAHEAIKNRVAEGAFKLVELNVEAEFTNYIAPPNVYTDIFMGSFGSVERGLIDGVAWELNPMEGPKILEGEEADSQKRQAALNEFLNWKKYYSDAKVLGETTVGDSPAWEIEFTTTAGKKLKHYFDKEIGLMVQTVAETVTTTYGDFKEVDGLKLPHKLASKGGKYNVEIIITSFKHNTEIPAEKFVLPPTIKELLNPPAPAPAPAAKPEADAPSAAPVKNDAAAK
jgi:outer membrane lipoprotein-sorting protein